VSTVQDYQYLLLLACGVIVLLGILLGATVRRLGTAKEIAKRAAQVKATLLTNLSHEIRTPMNGVMGMTNLLFTTNLTNEQRDYADAVLSSADSLLELLNNMLDYALMDEGKLQFENVDFDLHGLLEDVAEHFAAQAAGKQLELACMIAPETPHVVTGDPVKLRQILNNLMSNAVKFTAQGEIILSSKVVSVEPGGVVLHIEVSDTGIGISDEDRPKLFRTFGQLDSSSSRTHSGAGMGLAICKQIATGGRGYIDFHSKPGVGSSFWVVMRFGRPEYELPPTQADSKFVGRPVLVVSGSGAVRRTVLLYCRALRLEGREAASAADALALIKKTPVDLIVVDDRISNVIKLAEAKPPSTGMILLSSASESLTESAFERAETTRVDATISRPVKRLHFFRTIREFFARRPVRRPLVQPSDSTELSTHP